MGFSVYTLISAPSRRRASHLIRFSPPWPFPRYCASTVPTHACHSVNAEEWSTNCSLDTLVSYRHGDMCLILALLLLLGTARCLGQNGALIAVGLLRGGGSYRALSASRG
jgi:hypothetical protein